MAILGVDQFKAKLQGGGARPNLFKISLNYPGALGNAETDIASFLCNAGSLPTSNISPVAVPFRGRLLYVAGDRTFDPWSVNIINDTNFQVRKDMERWMSVINAHEENTGATNPLNYQCDLTVEQLDKDESTLYSYIFHGCFPTNISDIALAYGNNDTIEEFGVSFQVQYWTSYAGGDQSSGVKVTTAF